MPRWVRTIPVLANFWATFGVMDGPGNTLYRWPIKKSSDSESGDTLEEFQPMHRPGLAPTLFAGSDHTPWNGLGIVGDHLFIGDAVDVDHAITGAMPTDTLADNPAFRAAMEAMGSENVVAWGYHDFSKAADAFGGASRLVEASVEYARTREQFGVVIGQFQALKHQLANMALEVEPTRGLYWYAAHAFDHVPDEAERSAALAKAHVTDVFMQVARDAVEAHGGLGFTWECDVQIWYKRAMFDRAFLGTPEMHRERSVALAGW